MTRRFPVMLVNANIVVAHGRGLRIILTTSKVWDSTPYGSRLSPPISKARLLRAKPITGAYAVPFLCQRVEFILGTSYWTKDLDSLNPHFGTSDDLKALSNDLHKRGMYLMFDVVVNHMAAPSSNFTFTGFSQPFNGSSSFHKRCFVAESPDPSNQTAVEQCWLGDSKMPLPDLNTEDPTVIGKLLDWIHKLVQEYGLDGLRIDTVKHIRKDFWPDFSKAAGVFTLGEVLINDTDYASQYTGG
jgi:hypothetical protein